MPSSSMTARREEISLRIFPATSVPAGGNLSLAHSASRSRIESSPTSWMLRPPILTERLSFLRRAPPQSGQTSSVSSTSPHSLWVVL